MFNKSLLLFMFFAILANNGVFAQSGVPDLYNSSVRMPYLNDGTPHVINMPSGQGDALNNARIIGTGLVVDATIELTLRDTYDNPIPNFPAEDIWLGSPGGEFFTCLGGTWPEHEPNSLGITIWSSPLMAGGSTNGIIEVLINGNPVVGEGTPLSFAMNSPDINGDGQVNLVDVNLFSGIFFGTYDFSADFFPDGIINLADIPVMAFHGYNACGPYRRDGSSLETDTGKRKPAY